MTVRVENGDSRLVLQGFPDASIDAVVTDPPYALVSIVKRFANSPRNERTENTKNPYGRTGRGFMGQKWDTGETAFDPAFWVEVIRVMKPGAHLIAFGGTRTYHRLACAIEDAGFEIRDMIGWLYGSGFPKSHDVSKGIDRHNGDARPVVGRETLRNDIRGGALLDVAHGVYRPAFERDITSAASAASAAWEGWGTALKPAQEPIVLARKPLIGAVAENVLRYGTGAINIGDCRVEPTGESRERIAEPSQATRYTKAGSTNFAALPGVRGGAAQGRWPANIIHDGSEEVLAAFPDAGGQRAAANGSEPSSKTNNVYGQFAGRPATQPRGDSGSAARFFYTAKADAEDRLGSKHPTVKPIDLMAYLCRLVTPPGGTVLDPFAGTGTTGIAAMREGFDCILIEREERFVADISARLEALNQEGRHSASIKGRHVDQGKAGGADTPLFAANAEAAQ